MEEFDYCTSAEFPVTQQSQAQSLLSQYCSFSVTPIHHQFQQHHLQLDPLLTKKLKQQQQQQLHHQSQQQQQQHLVDDNSLDSAPSASKLIKEEEDSSSTTNSNVNIDVINTVRNIHNSNNNNNNNNNNRNTNSPNNISTNTHNSTQLTTATSINTDQDTNDTTRVLSNYTIDDTAYNSNIINLPLDQLYKTSSITNNNTTSSNSNNNNSHLMLIHQNISLQNLNQTTNSPSSITLNGNYSTLGCNLSINGNYSNGDPNGSHLFSQYNGLKDIQGNTYTNLQLSTSPLNHQSSILLSPTSSTSSSVVPTSPITLTNNNNCQTLTSQMIHQLPNINPSQLTPNGTLLGSNGSIINGLTLMHTSHPSKSSASSVKSNSSAVSSSSDSSLLGSNNAKRCRTAKKQIPDQQKDIKYFERRKRNNVAAKKSRDARKQREDEIAIRASFLEKENAILKAQLQTLKDEAQQLRILLAQKKNVNSGCTNCTGSCGANNNNTNGNGNSIINGNINQNFNKSPNLTNNANSNGTHNNRLYNSQSFDATDQLNVAKLTAYQHHL